MIDRTIGVVVIGRNEGQRLQRCLQSVLQQSDLVVYVDSGSSDGSATVARTLGAEVIELDASTSFSAARARNAGFARLVEVAPPLRAVHFVDGDCELAPAWLARASSVLATNPTVAVVCGRLRERCPNATIYNRLCNIEWNAPIGNVETCGGIAAISCDAFSRAGGFDERLLAGEEPELCSRILALGYTILRLPDEMAIHDAAIARFGQWWTRARRAGWAFAAAADSNKSRFGRHNTRKSVSAIAWGVAFPFVWLAMMVGGASTITFWWSSTLAASVYFILVFRAASWCRQKGETRFDSVVYGVFGIIAKTAESIGVLDYCLQKCRRREGRLIEYK